jgi:hypothetical protein
MVDFVTLEGYIVRRTTEKAVALVREGAGYQADLIWVPRSMCREGERIDVHETDLEVAKFVADDRGLDYD